MTVLSTILKFGPRRAWAPAVAAIMVVGVGLPVHRVSAGPNHGGGPAAPTTPKGSSGRRSAPDWAEDPAPAGDSAPAIVETEWPPENGKIIDRLIAVVNDEPITLYEMRRAAAPFVATELKKTGVTPDFPARLDQIQSEVLDNLINDILVYAEAKKLSLSADPARVDEYVERIKTKNEWSDDELRDQLKKSGFATVADFRRHTEREMIKGQAISIKVSSRVKLDPAEVEAALKREMGTAGVVQERRALHILIKLAEMGGVEAEAEAREKLERAKRQIASGEISFEEAARRLSDDANANAGGDLGWFSKGDFDPDFETAAFTLSRGAVSDPVRTRYGLHLIKVIDVREREVEGAPDMEARRRQVAYKMREAEVERLYSQWVKGLRAQAYIEIMDPALKRSPTRRPQG